jgi:hypothetical protein
LAICDHGSHRIELNELGVLLAPLFAINATMPSSITQLLKRSTIASN